MRVFAKLVLICNVCFIIAVIIRFVEISRKAQGNINGLIRFQPLEASLVILGYGAIVLNLIFVFFALYGLIAKRFKYIPRWIVYFNLLMFPLEVYYHFFRP